MSIRSRVSALAALACAFAAGCAPLAWTEATSPTPAPPQAAAPPASLDALHAAHDWQNEPGPELAAAFAAGARRVLAPMSLGERAAALAEAGYACAASGAGDAAGAACARSFATRACQMDWEIAAAAEVTARFRRDCVGAARDWPEAVRSAIDDQLAPPPPN